MSSKVFQLNKFFQSCSRKSILKHSNRLSRKCLLEKTKIQTCWKVLREAKMDPPIHTLYFLSGGATTLIFMLLGASAVISLLILSAMPGNMVDPPLSTIFPYKSFLISTSHFIMELYVVSWIPAASIPIIDGWKEDLRAAETLCPNGDHLPIRQLVALLDGRSWSWKFLALARSLGLCKPASPSCPSQFPARRWW